MSGGGDRRWADKKDDRGLWPAGLFVAVVVAAWVVPGTAAGEWIFCPLRRLVDLICPGCGMTRSITSFVRGEWAEAMAYHPGGPALMIGLGCVGGVRVGDRLAKERLFSGIRDGFDDVSVWFWGAVFVGLIALWGIRIATGNGV